jgi:hypothetical protein
LPGATPVPPKLKVADQRQSIEERLRDLYHRATSKRYHQSKRFEKQQAYDVWSESAVDFDEAIRKEQNTLFNRITCKAAPIVLALANAYQVSVYLQSKMSSGTALWDQGGILANGLAGAVVELIKVGCVFTLDSLKLRIVENWNSTNEERKEGVTDRRVLIWYAAGVLLAWIAVSIISVHFQYSFLLSTGNDPSDSMWRAIGTGAIGDIVTVVGLTAPKPSAADVARRKVQRAEGVSRIGNARIEERKVYNKFVAEFNRKEEV